MDKFSWEENEVELIMPKVPTNDEIEMYNRYCAYVKSGDSPYVGEPLSMAIWLKLHPSHRPGGPEIERAIKDRTAATRILTLHCADNKVGTAALVLEYVREAEHMEGSDYWDNFKTEKDLTDDFDLYAQNKD